MQVSLDLLKKSINENFIFYAASKRQHSYGLDVKNAFIVSFYHCMIMSLFPFDLVTVVVQIFLTLR